jgi:hypothetical protein
VLNPRFLLSCGVTVALAAGSLVGCGGDDGTAESGETHGNEAETDGHETETSDTDEPVCMGDDATRVTTILGLTGDETAGAAVFMNSCGLSACHGPDGNSGMGVSLSEHIPEHPPEELTCILLLGEGTMPSQGSLSDQNLADVLAYVQATFGG